MQHFGFFDAKQSSAGVLDRTYTSENFSAYLRNLICDGVLDTYGSQFQATTNGLNIYLGTGQAWIGGHYYYSDAQTSFSLSSYVDTALPRYVSVYLYCDTDESVRECGVEIVSGAASATPKPEHPANTKTKTYLLLYDVYLQANATKIDVLTDYRTYCKCILGKCKVTDMLSKMDQTNASLEECKTRITEQDSKIAELEAKIADFTSDLVAVGQCGDDVYYILYGDGTLLLRGTGATYDYRTGIYGVVDVQKNPSAFCKNTNIKKITISDGITRVGNGLFLDCPNAKTVSFPSSLTEIGIGAFFISMNTSDIGHGLQQLTIPSTVKYLEAYAFCNTAIIDVIIPFNVTTWESYVFSECKKLTTVRVESSLIGGFAFTSCTALTSLTISANCTKIGTCMLTYCSSLTEITYEGTKAQWDAIEKGTNWDSRHGADHEDVLSKIICSDGNWIFNEETKTWEEETA